MSVTNPTNRDLLKEVKVIQVTVAKIDGRLRDVEVWKLSQDAGRSAIAEYKRDQVTTIRKELLQALLPLAIALTGLVIYLTTKK